MTIVMTHIQRQPSTFTKLSPVQENHIKCFCHYKPRSDGTGKRNQNSEEWGWQRQGLTKPK